MTKYRRDQAFATYQTTMRQFLQVQAALIGQLLARQPALIPQQSGEVSPVPGPSILQASSLPRCRIEAVPQPLPAMGSIRPEGLFLIIADSLGVASLVAQTLEQQGAEAVVLAAEQLASEQALAHLDLSQHRPLQGIVHLASLEIQGLPDSLEEWRTYSQIHVKGCFRLLQRYLKELQTAHQPRILAASLLGGCFGRGDRPMAGLATGGGNLGLLKTLAIEWPQIQVKGIDCDRLPVEAIAQQICQELLTTDPEIEVGYPHGQRTIFTSVAAPLESTQQLSERPNSAWVLLVTGGSRGITAEVLKSLVVPGMTLILVGRSPRPPAEPSATAGIQDTDRLRQQLLTIARTEGRQTTPKQIEQDLNHLLNTRQSRQNVDWFRQHCQVEYYAIDVRDGEALAQLIQSIYSRYGRLDGVIHGAGVIEDKLIADKTPESFDRVFDTKVDSVFSLSRCLRPDSLKLLVLFASVAGRYGNRGQADYAAANEVITRLAWQLDQRWRTTRVVALQWGPWDTTGMASEAVKQKFRDQGVIPIPLDVGSQYFIDELLFGAKGDTEIIAGEGPWCHLTKPSAPAAAELPTALGFIQQQPELQPDNSITLRHLFSLANDPYLTHHRLDGRPVLPVAAAAEWLAEMVQAAWPTWAVTEILDLQMLGGVVLPDDQATLPVLFQAKASSHADATALQVAVAMVDESTERSLYRSLMQLQPDWQQADTRKPWSPLRQSTGLSAQHIYDRHLFHGPRFQLITTIERLDLKGIDATCRVSFPQDWLNRSNAAWLFDPGLLDLGPQLATVWSQEIHQTFALPTRFGRIVRYPAAPADCLSIQFRIRSHSPHRLTYDALFLNLENRVVMLMETIESNCTAALNRLGAQSSL